MVIFGIILLIIANAVTPMKVGSNRLYILLLLSTLPFMHWNEPANLELYNGYLAITPLTSGLTKLVIIISAASAITISNVKVNGPMILLCSTGALFMIESNHLISLFLSLELQSFTAYLLVATSPAKKEDISASILYLILGALASSIMLLGISLLYSTTGLLDYATLLQFAQGNHSKITISFIIFIIGSAFKLGLAPLHQWTPEVYGSINNGTIAFVSLVPKFGILSFYHILLAEVVPETITISIIGFSIIVGSIGGLSQQNYRRLIAYSSIAHIGYLTFAATYSSDSTVLFYAIQYAVITFATLSCFTSLDTSNSGQISSLKGALHTSPALSLTLIALVLSLAGIPPLVGFFAKLEILYSIVESKTYLLSLIAIITSGISAFYYLRIISIIITPTATNNSWSHSLSNPFNSTLSYLQSATIVLAILACLDIQMLENITMVGLSLTK